MKVFYTQGESPGFRLLTGCTPPRACQLSASSLTHSAKSDKTLTQSWKTGSQILALLIGDSGQEADAVRKFPPQGVLGFGVSVNVQVIASTKR